MFAMNRAGVYITFDQSLPLPMSEVVGAVTYLGYCTTLGTGFDKPKWMIIRITEAAGLTTPEYAEGNAKFEHKWSDRATINYSR